MMIRDRSSNSVKARRSKTVKTTVSNKPDTSTPPPLVRSNTLPINHTVVPRVPRSSSLGLPEKEKARSDDGFHSDSDKDSNQSANSNMSVNSNKSYLTKPPSIKSNVVAKVRSRSSLGTMSDNSSSSLFDIANLNRQLQADKQAEEARKNRKIEDLEISIQSLTRFNAELEATNKKQFGEIQELKRKLRILNSLKSIYGSDDEFGDEEDDVSTPLSEVDLEEIKQDNDSRFRRICIVIDGLVQDANKALAYTSKIGGRQVLTNAQLDSNNTESQNSESNKTSDSFALPDSPKDLEVPKELESNSAEESEIDAITIKTKSNSNIINEQTFINDLKIKLTVEKDDTNSTTLAEFENQRLQANLERARTVANELLSLEKRDNNVNNNNVSSNSGLKGLGLLLTPEKVHSFYGSNNTFDSPQPSPRMVLLYELQESLGIGDAESHKYLKENRRSLPATLSGRTYSSVTSSSEESQERGDSRPSIRIKTQPNNKAIRRRSSPNFRHVPFSNMPIEITDHNISSHVKKDDSILNSLTHSSNTERRSILTSPLVLLTSPFRN